MKMQQSKSGGHGDNPQGRLQEVNMENPQRLNVQSQPEKLQAQWVVGFVDGEGCFYVGINPHPEMSCQFQVLPEFTVVQHRRDIQLLHALKKFFGCGVVRQNHGDRMAYRVRGLDHLIERIVPFFEKHPLKSKKRVDFARFRKILHLINQGKHLKREGIEEIREIASVMNTGMHRQSNGAQAHHRSCEMVISSEIIFGRGALRGV
jgi:hypothetical protein